MPATSGKQAFCGLLLAANLCFAAVPTPESHFGHPIGVDRQLLDWDKVVSYFYALARPATRSALPNTGVPPKTGP